MTDNFALFLRGRRLKSAPHDEAKHPRKPKGNPQGGEFADKPGAGDDAPQRPALTYDMVRALTEEAAFHLIERASFDEVERELKHGGGNLLLMPTVALLARAGYRKRPVVRYGNKAYLLLNEPSIQPGANEVDVVDMRPLPEDKDEVPFAIFGVPGREFGYSYEGEYLDVLGFHKRSRRLATVTKPFTARFAYRVSPPTREDALAMRDRMDDEPG